MNARTVFVLKEGVVRRGIPIGTVVTMVYVVTSLRHGDFTSGFLRTTVLIVLCFVMWGGGAGWFIGEFLWSLMARRHGQRAVSPTRTGSVERHD